MASRRPPSLGRRQPFGWPSPVCITVLVSVLVGGVNGCQLASWRPQSWLPQNTQPAHVASAPPLLGPPAELAPDGLSAEAPEAQAPGSVPAVNGPLPEPTVELPEIGALALARQILAGEAHRRLSEKQREQVARILADAEQEYGLDVTLVLALMFQESSFNPKAVSNRGAVGLMQVRPFVGEDVAVRNGLPWRGAGTLLDPAHNVRIGIHYLAELVDMFGFTEHALAAYNMGPYRLRRLLRRGLDPRDYVDRVYHHYEGYQARYGLNETGWGG